VGVGVVISELYGRRNPPSPNQLLDRFKNHPCIRPLVKGGKTLEYSAHMIPMDGYKNLPRFYTNGLMLIGDAAGLVNNSICHEGVNMAMASGIMAAETILDNRAEKCYDVRALRQYERRLKNSFVLQNMKSSRDFIDILRTHTELLNDYPHLMKNVITSYFKVSDVPKSTIKRDIVRMVRSRVNFVKAAKTVMALMKGGI
jgi:electron transfer flavoprotein-quinone oxidoreductase